MNEKLPEKKKYTIILMMTIIAIIGIIDNLYFDETFRGYPTARIVGNALRGATFEILFRAWLSKLVINWLSKAKQLSFGISVYYMTLVEFFTTIIYLMVKLVGNEQISGWVALICVLAQYPIISYLFVKQGLISKKVAIIYAVIGTVFSVAILMLIAALL